MTPDQAQAKAIAWGKGPCAVVAGPGSGKTMVIVERICHLIKQMGVAPNQITTLTFTKAAAMEMQYRFDYLTNGAYPQVVFGTFHGVCFRLLSAYGWTKDIVFWKDTDKRKVMQQVLQSLGLRHTSSVIDAHLRGVSRCKQAGYSFNRDMLIQSCGEVPDAEQFPEVFSRFETERKLCNCMGLDDVVRDCLQAVLEQKDFYQMVRHRFSFLQIDEFQDVNRVQYELALRVTKEGQNLFVVGDDDQAIYGFRGASPQVFQRFFKDYPNSAAYYLETNYRAAKNLIVPCTNLISENQSRLQKQMLPAPHAVPGCFEVKICASKEEELEYLVQRLQQGRQNGAIPMHKTAILVRTSFQAFQVAKCLEEANLLFHMKENMRRPFTEEAVLDVLAYLSFVYRGRRRCDFLRLMNRPLRYLPRSCVPEEVVEEPAVYKMLSGRGEALLQAKKLFRGLNMLESLNPSLALSYIRNHMGYDRFCRSETDGAGYDLAFQALERLCLESKSFQSGAVFLNHIDQLRLQSENRGTHRGDLVTNKQGIRLMTMHAAKGLEFERVCLPFLRKAGEHTFSFDIGEGMPSEDPEESRRILYVAMTRAKQELILTCSFKNTPHMLK